MKVLISTIKYSLLAGYLGMVALTLAAYLNLPVSTKPLVVQTGSMSPAIDAGSLILISKNQTTTGVSYYPGEVITFKKGSELVSHRIKDFHIEEGRTFYQTQGDANKTPDSELVSQADVVGKVLFSVPFVGKLVDFTKQPVGFLTLIAIPTLLFILSELLTIFEEIKKKPKKEAKSINIYKPITLTVLSLFFVGSTLSYFSDVRTSTGNTFSTAEQFTSTLRISEVQITGGPGDAEHDFVEFYNPTSLPFDLNGHRLVKRTGNSAIDTTMKSWTTSTIVQAHGYYLWANNSDSAFPTSVSADTATSIGIGSSNSIALRNGSENSGLIVDSVSWNDGSTLGEGTVFAPDPGANQSIERKAISTSTAASLVIGGVDEFKGNGFDAGNNATDFVLRPVSQPQNSSSATESP